MTKSHNTVKRVKKNVYLCDKKSKTSAKKTLKCKYK